MNKIISLLIGILILVCCEKNNINDLEINDSLQNYKDFQPDIKVFIFDSALIDMDKNGVQDVLFTIDYYSDPMVYSLNDSIEVSGGEINSNPVYIIYNDVLKIIPDVYWWRGFNLGSSMKYIGVRKSFDDKFLYGWIKLDVPDYTTLYIDSYYFRKEPETLVRAGISNYP